MTLSNESLNRDKADIPAAYDFYTPEGKREINENAYEAVSELRLSVHRGLVLGGSIILVIGLVFLSTYVLRDKINYQFEKHGIKVCLFVPTDARSMQR